jgi:hypothetical protein
MEFLKKTLNKTEQFGKNKLSKSFKKLLRPNSKKATLSPSSSSQSSSSLYPSSSINLFYNSSSISDSNMSSSAQKIVVPPFQPEGLTAQSDLVGIIDSLPESAESIISESYSSASQVIDSNWEIEDVEVSPLINHPPRKLFVSKPLSNQNSERMYSRAFGEFENVDRMLPTQSQTIQAMAPNPGSEYQVRPMSSQSLTQSNLDLVEDSNSSWTKNLAMSSNSLAGNRPVDDLFGESVHESRMVPSTHSPPASMYNPLHPNAQRMTSHHIPTLTTFRNPAPAQSDQNVFDKQQVYKYSEPSTYNAQVAPAHNPGQGIPWASSNQENKDGPETSSNRIVYSTSSNDYSENPFDKPSRSSQNQTISSDNDYSKMPNPFDKPSIVPPQAPKVPYPAVPQKPKILVLSSPVHTNSTNPSDGSSSSQSTLVNQSQEDYLRKCSLMSLNPANPDSAKIAGEFFSNVIPPVDQPISNTVEDPNDSVEFHDVQSDSDEIHDKMDQDLHLYVKLDLTSSKTLIDSLTRCELPEGSTLYDVYMNWNSLTPKFLMSLKKQAFAIKTRDQLLAFDKANRNMVSMLLDQITYTIMRDQPQISKNLVIASEKLAIHSQLQNDNYSTVLNAMKKLQADQQKMNEDLHKTKLEMEIPKRTPVPERTPATINTDFNIQLFGHPFILQTLGGALVQISPYDNNLIKTPELIKMVGVIKANFPNLLPHLINYNLAQFNKIVNQLYINTP